MEYRVLGRTGVRVSALALGTANFADPTPEDFAFITRTAEFTWPELPLGGAYQIRGFFDYDGNFNPFFSVTNIPTAGDIGGGAFVDPVRAQRQQPACRQHRSL